MDIGFFIFPHNNENLFSRRSGRVAGRGSGAAEPSGGPGGGVVLTKRPCETRPETYGNASVFEGNPKGKLMVCNKMHCCFHV